MSLSDKKNLRNEIRGSGFTMDQVAEAMEITKPTLYARINKMDEEPSILQNVKDAIKKLSGKQIEEKKPDPKELAYETLEKKYIKVLEENFELQKQLINMIQEKREHSKVGQ